MLLTTLEGNKYRAKTGDRRWEAGDRIQNVERRTIEGDLQTTQRLFAFLPFTY